MTTTIPEPSGRLRAILDRAGLYSPADAEREPGFRDEIIRASATGIRLCSLLAMLGPTFVIAMYLPLAEFPVSFWPDPVRDTWAVWDGALIVTLGLLTFFLARWEWVVRRGRLIVAIDLIVMCTALTMDASVATGFLAYQATVPFMIVMLGAMGTMPYRASHMFYFGLCLLAAAHLGIEFTMPLFGEQGQRPPPGIQTVMIMIVLFCTGISALLYASRYRQYCLRKEERALRERATESEAQARAYAADLERANQTIKDAQVQLIHSEKMASLGHLVAGVAHEINTPLGSINSNADVSRRALEIVRQYLEESSQRPEEALPDRVKQAIGILVEANTTTLSATQRIVGIVRSLRNFARLDEAELKEVDIHEGIESTVTLAYHEFKNRIDIVRDFGDLPKIWCYPTQLNQVFMNVLVNAIHAIAEKGTITITTRRAGDNITIAFGDTGHGISPDHLKRIFDPGFTTKGVGVGTGLGLSIVYKIIRAHDGRIDVASAVGKGTVFTITLPVKGPEKICTPAMPL